MGKYIETESQRCDVNGYIHLANSNTNPRPPLSILFANCYKHPLTFSHSISETWQEYPIYLRVDHNLTKSGKLAKIL